MKKGDIVIVVVALLLAVIGGSIYYLTTDRTEEGAMIVVEIDNVEVDRKLLYVPGRDHVVVYDGTAGETIVHFLERGARVVESACPDKICIQYGSMDRPGQNNACLPNRVVFRIIGGKNEETDINTR